MLQALQALQTSAAVSPFACISHSSSISGGSDPCSALSSEQQQFSLPPLSSSGGYFSNSPPCSIGGDASTADVSTSNNPDICVTTDIGDEVLLLGGGAGGTSSAVMETNASTALTVSSSRGLAPSKFGATSLTSSTSNSNSEAFDVEPMDMDESR